jgi:hypothetical protein
MVRGCFVASSTLSGDSECTTAYVLGVCFDGSGTASDGDWRIEFAEDVVRTGKGGRCGGGSRSYAVLRVVVAGRPVVANDTNCSSSLVAIGSSWRGKRRSAVSYVEPE